MGSGVGGMAPGMAPGMGFMPGVNVDPQAHLQQHVNSHAVASMAATLESERASHSAALEGERSTMQEERDAVRREREGLEAERARWKENMETEQAQSGKKQAVQIARTVLSRLLNRSKAAALYTWKMEVLGYRLQRKASTMKRTAVAAAEETHGQIVTRMANEVGSLREENAALEGRCVDLEAKIKVITEENSKMQAVQIARAVLSRLLNRSKAAALNTWKMKVLGYRLLREAEAKAVESDAKVKELREEMEAALRTTKADRVYSTIQRLVHKSMFAKQIKAMNKWKMIVATSRVTQEAETEAEAKLKELAQKYKNKEDRGRRESIELSDKHGVELVQAQAKTDELETEMASMLQRHKEAVAAAEVEQERIRRSSMTADQQGAARLVAAQEEKITLEREMTEMLAKVTEAAEEEKQRLRRASVTLQDKYAVDLIRAQQEKEDLQKEMEAALERSKKISVRGTMQRIVHQAMYAKQIKAMNTWKLFATNSRAHDLLGKIKRQGAREQDQLAVQLQRARGEATDMQTKMEEMVQRQQTMLRDREDRVRRESIELSNKHGVELVQAQAKTEELETEMASLLRRHKEAVAAAEVEQERMRRSSMTADEAGAMELAAAQEEKRRLEHEMRDMLEKVTEAAETEKSRLRRDSIALQDKYAVDLVRAQQEKEDMRRDMEAALEAGRGEMEKLAQKAQAKTNALETEMAAMLQRHKEMAETAAAEQESLRRSSVATDEERGVQLVVAQDEKRRLEQEMKDMLEKVTAAAEEEKRRLRRDSTALQDKWAVDLLRAQQEKENMRRDMKAALEASQASLRQSKEGRARATMQRIVHHGMYAKQIKAMNKWKMIIESSRVASALEAKMEELAQKYKDKESRIRRESIELSDKHGVELVRAQAKTHELEAEMSAMLRTHKEAAAAAEAAQDRLRRSSMTADQQGAARLVAAQEEKIRLEQEMTEMLARVTEAAEEEKQRLRRDSIALQDKYAVDLVRAQQEKEDMRRDMEVALEVSQAAAAEQALMLAEKDSTMQAAKRSSMSLKDKFALDKRKTERELTDTRRALKTAEAALEEAQGEAAKAAHNGAMRVAGKVWLAWMARGRHRLVSDAMGRWCAVAGIKGKLVPDGFWAVRQLKEEQEALRLEKADMLADVRRLVAKTERDAEKRFQTREQEHRGLLLHAKDGLHKLQLRLREMQGERDALKKMMSDVDAEGHHLVASGATRVTGAGSPLAGARRGSTQSLADEFHGVVALQQQTSEAKIRRLEHELDMLRRRQLERDRVSANDFTSSEFDDVLKRVREASTERAGLEVGSPRADVGYKGGYFCAGMVGGLADTDVFALHRGMGRGLGAAGSAFLDDSETEGGTSDYSGQFSSAASDSEGGGHRGEGITDSYLMGLGGSSPAASPRSHGMGTGVGGGRPGSPRVGGGLVSPLGGDTQSVLDQASERRASSRGSSPVNAGTTVLEAAANYPALAQLGQPPARVAIAEKTTQGGEEKAATTTQAASSGGVRPQRRESFTMRATALSVGDAPAAAGGGEDDRSSSKLGDMLSDLASARKSGKKWETERTRAQSTEATEEKEKEKEADSEQQGEWNEETWGVFGGKAAATSATNDTPSKEEEEAPTEEEAPQEATEATVTLTYDMDFDELMNDPAAKAAFEASVIAEMVASAGVSADDVEIAEILPGSVIIVLKVKKPPGDTRPIEGILDQFMENTTLDTSAIQTAVVGEAGEAGGGVDMDAKAEAAKAKAESAAKEEKRLAAEAAEARGKRQAEVAAAAAKAEEERLAKEAEAERARLAAEASEAERKRQAAAVAAAKASIAAQRRPSLAASVANSMGSALSSQGSMAGSLSQLKTEFQGDIFDRDDGIFGGAGSPASAASAASSPSADAGGRSRTASLNSLSQLKPERDLFDRDVSDAIFDDDDVTVSDTGLSQGETDGGGDDMNNRNSFFKAPKGPGAASKAKLVVGGMVDDTTDDDSEGGGSGWRG